MSNPIVMIALLGCFLSACQSEVKVESIASPSSSSVLPEIPEFTSGIALGGLFLPDNSKIILSDDGTSVTFEFPEGIYFVKEESEGKPSLQKAITYACACADGEAGTLLYYENQIGCLHGSCEGSSLGAYTLDGKQAEILSGGFIDLNQEVSFLTSDEAAGSLFTLYPAVLDLPEVTEGLTLLSLHQVAVLTQGYEGPSRVVGVNFYGNLVGISLPETYLATLPHAGLFRTVDCEAGKSVTQRKGISIFSGASLRIL